MKPRRVIQIPPAVTFIAPKDPRISKNYRLPESVLRYLKEAALARQRTQTDIIIDALSLSRELASRLESEWSRVQAYASSEKLDIHKDLIEVIARLVEAGLTVLDKRNKK